MSISSLLEDVRTLRRLPTPSVARSIREAAGVSQAQLAEVLGVDRVTVTRWESGRRRPQGRSARRYAALIDRLRKELAE